MRNRTIRVFFSRYKEISNIDTSFPIREIGARAKEWDSGEFADAMKGDSWDTAGALAGGRADRQFRWGSIRTFISWLLRPLIPLHPAGYESYST